MADCDEALRLNPKYALGYVNRCWAWNLTNEPDRAMTDCNEAIRLDPNLAGAFNVRGDAWFAKRDCGQPLDRSRPGAGRARRGDARSLCGEGRAGGAGR